MLVIETIDFADSTERPIGRIQGCSPKEIVDACVGSEEHFLVWSAPNIKRADPLFDQVHR
uniref:Uncharacterized protein n=1 Tax=Rhizobium loti TaxID=381 RepID=Q8KGU8_RHILI|nr:HYPOTHETICAL PROTEIN [Mesorhizobium japonicum R7A]